MITGAFEKILLERVAYGDRAAFRALFDEYYPKVYGFLRGILPVPEDASDLSQEIFVKIWLMRAALPDIVSFNSYIYRMTLNHSINFVRANKQQFREALVDVPYNQMIEDFIDIRGKEAFIASIVNNMPKQRRKVFVMSRIEHKSNEEIALLLNIKRKTVENHLNLALRELRACLPSSLFLLLWMVQ